MPQNINLGPVLIPLAALLLGWIIGFFDSNNRTARKVREAERKSEIAIAQAKEETKLAVEAAIAQAQAAVTAPPENSLLRLGIDEYNQPTLDLDGRRVETPELAPEQRKRLIDLMVTMRPWIEGSASQRSAESSPAAARPIAAHTPSLTKPVPPPGTVPTPPAAAPAPRQPAAPVVSAPVIPSKEAVAEPTTMVGQIDAILQAHLAGTPLSSRKIRLIESLKGGVIVMIDKDRYESISDVPDAEILAAIRASVAEWEKKYTPGM